MANLGDIAKSIGRYAPLLGTALGGSAGGMIGSFVANALGVPLDKIPDTLSQDSEMQQKLVSLEYAHEEELQRLTFNDTANARAREVSLAQANKRDWIPSILSIGFLIIYAALQAYAIYSPGTQDDVISARVQDILVIIIGYYFGSSMEKKQ